MAPAGVVGRPWSGRHLKPASDGTLEVSADDAKSLIAQGWQKLKEWTADEIPKHAQTKPPKTNWAIGSMQWEKEQEKGERPIARPRRPRIRYCWPNSRLLGPPKNRDYPLGSLNLPAQLFDDISPVATSTDVTHRGRRTGWWPESGRLCADRGPPQVRARLLRWSKGDSNSRSHRERSGHGRAPHTNHRTIARERSLSFRHLSSTARGIGSSNPLCSSGELLANLSSSIAAPAHPAGAERELTTLGVGKQDNRRQDQRSE